MKTKNIILALLALVASYSLAHAQVDGTWITTSAPSPPYPIYSSTTNWQGGIVANGGIAYLTAPTAAVNFNVDGSRSITGLSALAGAGWSNYTYTIGRQTGSSTLTLLESGGNSPVVNLSAATNAARINLNVPLIATNGIKFQGDGSGTQIVNLNPSAANTISGGIEIESVSLWLSKSMADTLGSSTPITLSGDNARLSKRASGDVTYTNDIILNSQTSGLELGATGSLTLNGTISEVVSTNSNLIYAATGSGDGYRYYVNGNNSYTGDTQVGGSGRAFVRISHNNALGTGSAEVSFGHDNSALELTGGITVSNKTLLLGGTGNLTNGQFRTVGGSNTWAGDVEIVAGKEGVIGIDNGTQLTIDGIISDNLTSTGLRKASGNGILVLTGANTYASGTTIDAGMIHAGNNSALGTGDLAIGANAGLQINAGINLAGVEELSFLDSTSRLVFDLNLGAIGTLFSAASQAGNGTYTVDLLNAQTLGVGEYTLLSIAGIYEASGFDLGSATFDGNLSGSLGWDSGILTLYVVPEPSSFALLLGGAIALGWYSRKKKLRRG